MPVKEIDMMPRSGYQVIERGAGGGCPGVDDPCIWDAGYMRVRCILFSPYAMFEVFHDKKLK